MSQTETATKKSSRHECQICESAFTVSKKGTLSKHGYKRPGDGFLHGECYGAHRAPFPAVDALLEYRAIIASMLSDAFAAERALCAETPRFFHKVSFYCENKDLRIELNRLALRRESDPYVYMNLEFVPGVSSTESYGEFGYWKNLNYKIAAARGAVKRLLGELARVDARIAKGQAAQKAA